MDYSALIHNVYKQCQREADEGNVASYIPELAKVDGSQFGICLATVDGNEYYVGDASTKFSIQSIVKVFTLAMVYQKLDELLWTRVGVEPSGGAFNSLALRPIGVILFSTPCSRLPSPAPGKSKF